jgi:hypothetical protein
VSDVSASLRAIVVDRAGDRCEYRGLSQVGQEATFHIDHVVPASAGGPTRTTNLALAWVGCSLFKGARRTAVDPKTGEDASLYIPRRQRWTRHFRWDRETAVGVTRVGRATVAALRMNRPVIVSIRKEEAARGRHPHV